MNPKISVIIPTINYSNRKDAIDRILVSLDNQKTAVPFEVIIVNNEPGSTKREFDIVSASTQVIHEPEAGLSRARNAGVKVAIGNIIAFLDDDVIPAPTWLGAIVQTHKLQTALCVGGPVTLIDSSFLRFPKWFSDYFLRFIIPPQFPKSTEVITSPYYIVGANMSFKRDVFASYGFFDTNLGRVGACLLSGEDMEFMMRIPSEGIFYEPLAGVSTKMTSLRLTRGYFVRRIFWQAISEARIFRKHGFDRYYDRSELFLSPYFGNKLLATLQHETIFQAICMIIRIITFNIVSLLRL